MPTYTNAPSGDQASDRPYESIVSNRKAVSVEILVAIRVAVAKDSRVAVGVGVAVGLGDGVGGGLGVAVGEGVAVAVGSGVAVGVQVAVGKGVAEALVAEGVVVSVTETTEEGERVQAVSQRSEMAKMI